MLRVFLWGSRPRGTQAETVARLLIRSHRLDDAAPLLDWILTFQPVAHGGVTYHQPTGPMWGSYLRTRFGGCMAETTCVLGLVLTMSARVAARDCGVDLGSDSQLVVMKQLLTDRRVMFGRSGSIMALAHPSRWTPTGGVGSARLSARLADRSDRTGGPRQVPPRTWVNDGGGGRHDRIVAPARRRVACARTTESGRCHPSGTHRPPATFASHHEEGDRIGDRGPSSAPTRRPRSPGGP